MNNNYREIKNLIEITLLSKGKVYVCKINKADLYLVNPFNWYYKTGYAYTRINGKEVSMHVLLLGIKEGFIVDHINRSRLDNRRINLRHVTKSQNGMNRVTRGYYWNKQFELWESQIRVKSKKLFLGRFEKEQDALNSRIKAEKKYYGQFAYKR